MPDESTVELRIHGVSGASAEELLEVQPAGPVSGDDLAGFYRRRSAADAETVPGVTREAFAWGNLTSGRSSRALWLLLLPFMLVNVAYWMGPRGTGDDRALTHRAVEHGYDVLVRLLALSLTVLLTLAAAGVGMDLVGWQCAGHGSACARLRPWLGFLSEPGAPLATPGRSLTVGALLPLLVVAVLWRLSRRTGVEYEVVSATMRTSRDADAPLSDPRFWHNGAAVGRLRSAHIAVALATIALSLAVPPLTHDRASGAAPAGTVLVGLIAATAAVSTVSLFVPTTARTVNHVTARLCRALRNVSTLLLALAVGYALWPRPGWTATGTLPGHTVLLDLLLAAQCLVGALLAVTAVIQYRRGRAHAETAMGGLAGPSVAATGVVLGGVFSAALVHQSAGWLGGCHYQGAERAGCMALRPPDVYAWLQMAFTLEAVIALGTAGVVWLLLRGRARAEREAVAGRYQRSTTAARTRDIARARALGSLTEVLPACLGALLLPVVALAALALYAALTGRLTGDGAGGGWGGFVSPVAVVDAPGWANATVAAMVGIGAWLGGAFLLALMWLGRSAYRDRPTRQAVGVLWDIGTFWPRAAHPLAPPSYAERAVPQLATRIAGLTADGTGVVVSGHSQGSVLAAAAVWQLPGRCRDRVVLITHGSPLYRLYGRYFPAYFGPEALGELRGRVAGWRNLWRATDAVGGPIPTDRGDVGFAEPLPDPRHYERRGGEALYPRVLGHSDYTGDPAYRDAVAAAARRLAGTRPGSDASERAGEERDVGEEDATTGEETLEPYQGP
ncbi:hypothetical protein GCM10027294_11090 [Marinactinospora endophytica]